MENKEKLAPNSSVVVDGKTVNTYKQEIEGLNTIEVEVGTTGHKGGDAGHGCRTYLKIKNIADTWIAPWCDEDSVEITLGGDSELDTFCEALRIGYEVLKKHASDIDSYMPSSLELRQTRFTLYVNELCALYRKQRSLSGMGKIRDKHHITGLTKQQFFECDLNRAKGFVSRDFCDKVYAFILDTTKAIPAPKYNE